MSKKLLKRMSLVEVTAKYQFNEEACNDLFFNIKYPNGYLCSRCGHKHYSFISTNKNYQCKKCFDQESLKARTIMQDSKLSLYTWILAIYLLAINKTGISADNLATQLDISRKAAQLLHRKITYAMECRNNDFKLSETVELDASFIGTPSKNGKRGIGTDKQSFLCGVSYQTEYNDMYIKLQPINGENESEIRLFCDKHIDLNHLNRLITDAKRSYNFISKENLDIFHQSQIIDHEDPNNTTLKWLHTIVGNFKSFVDGCFHGIQKDYLRFAFAQFEWRFNRRWMKGDGIFNSLAKAVVCAKTMTRKMLVNLFKNRLTETGV
jgi:DNA-directed RNA polymerase subunit RPC12/RpoP